MTQRTSEELDAWVKAQVDTWPPLTAEQRATIALIVAGNADRSSAPSK